MALSIWLVSGCFPLSWDAEDYGKCLSSKFTHLYNFSVWCCPTSDDSTLCLKASNCNNVTLIPIIISATHARPQYQFTVRCCRSLINNAITSAVFFVSYLIMLWRRCCFDFCCRLPSTEAIKNRMHSRFTTKTTRRPKTKIKITELRLNDTNQGHCYYKYFYNSYYYYVTLIVLYK